MSLQNTLIQSHRHGLVYPGQFMASRYFGTEMTADWPEGIKKFLEKECITSPTPIQEKTLSWAMENKDLVGVARTGSGKTLAFVIPAVMKILRENQSTTNDTNEDHNDHITQKYGSRKEKKPTCLVLAPTRELASQTSDVVRKFRHLGIKSISLVGGASRSDQVYELGHADQDIYIATPGRLMDLVETNVVDLSNIKYLVLDEADRMLDMGFEPQIRRIVQRLSNDRQTLMFSATWPKEIQSLASEFLKDYKYVAVDSENLKANPNIKQVVEICQPHDKFRVFLDHLNKFKDEIEEPRSLVFVNTKRLADTILLQLMRNRYRAISMHGDRTQRQRDHALRLFKERQCNIMVATDVAARGLDINDITHVVNFDFPNTIEDYIHRIGRTARHEKSGKSLTLFTANNASLAPKLIKVLRETNQEVPEDLEEMARNKHLYGSETKDFSMKKRQRDDFYSTGRMRSRSFDGGPGRESYGARDNYSPRGGYASRDSYASRDNYAPRDSYRDSGSQFGGSRRGGRREYDSNDAMDDDFDFDDIDERPRRSYGRRPSSVFED